MVVLSAIENNLAVRLYERYLYHLDFKPKTEYSVEAKDKVLEIDMDLMWMLTQKSK